MLLNLADAESFALFSASTTMSQNSQPKPTLSLLNYLQPNCPEPNYPEPVHFEPNPALSLTLSLTILGVTLCLTLLLPLRLTLCHTQP